MLNMKISTYQTGGLELPVDNVLIAEAVDIASELYLSALIDRVNRCVTFMGSAAGGVDIEAGRRNRAGKNHHGAGGQHCRAAALPGTPDGFWHGSEREYRSGSWARSCPALYRLFRDKDLSLIEVNPLIIDKRRQFAGAGCQDQRGRQRIVPSPRTGRDAR